MPWYKSGTVNVIQNSNAVIGTGTAFIANGRVGDAFQGPDGDWYEVTNIASDTAVSIAPNYKGVTSAAGVYALAPMQGYNKATADALRQASLQVGDALDGLEESVLSASNSAAAALASKDSAATSETGASASADAALASKNAASLSETNSAASADAALASKNAASLSATNAGTSEGNAANSAAAAAASAAAANGVGQGYIEGLIPSWNSGSSITISPGAAVIQSSGKVVRVNSAITITGLSGLTTDVFYYFYLYDNAGTPAIEVVITATAAPYSGSARSKNGDTSRRFVCALRSGAGGTIYRFQWCQDNLIRFITTTNAAPFRAVTNASNTTKTVVNVQSLVPANTATALLSVINAAGSGPILQVSHPDANDTDILFGVAPNTRFPCVVPLDSLRRFAFYNSASGGGAFFDVCGYGTDR